MKKFVIKVCVFIIVFLSIVIGLDYLSMTEQYRMPLAKLTNSEDYISVNVGPDEIKPYIKKAGETNEYTQLIIGDSVCRQMFDGLQQYNSEICILGSNGSVTMTGQYILAKLFIESHPETTDIWLIVLPTALKGGFGLRYGYQYAVMPFVETDTLQYLEQDTIDEMADIYGRFFLRKDVVYAIDRSGINRKIYLNALSKKEQVQGAEVGETSVLYICKIMELCEENDIRLHMLPGPVSDANEDSEYMCELAKEYSISPLMEMFPEYLNQIKYYPAEQFGDGLHFSGDYANQQQYNKKIWEIYGESGLMEFLRTE